MKTLVSLVTLIFYLIPLPALAQQHEALLKMTSLPAIKQGYVDTSDGQLHFWQAGAGPALLLIHQSSSSIEEFAGMVPYLANQYRLIAFDWPGHGGSDDPPREYEIDDFTRSALAVVDQLDVERFHVLGHHGGALIAMNLAWQHPDRINKIILSGTSGVKSEAEAAAFTASLDIEKRNTLEADGRSLDDAWKRYTAYMPHSAPEEILIAFINNTITRVRPYDAHYGVLRWDRRPALEALKERKILLMQGENDNFVSHQETLLGILTNAEREVVKNSGTFLFFERPDAAAKKISRFLAE